MKKAISFKKLSRMFSRKDRLNNLQLLVGILVIGVIGVVLLITSQALNNSTDLEPESGSISGACIRSDTTASGGSAVQFSGSDCQLDITPQTLATLNSHTGTAFSASLNLSDGTAADWSIIGGELPPGLTLGSNRISGTPRLAGTYTFEVKAVFKFIGHIEKNYTIIVKPPATTGYETRVSNLLNAHVTSPWPTLPLCPGDPGYTDAKRNDTGFGIPSYATAALWLNRNAAQANALLTKVKVRQMTGGFCTNTNTDGQENLWLNNLLRPYFLYNDTSSFFPGRLTAAAQNNLAAQIWEWTNNFSVAATGDATNTWLIHDSENHEAQQKSMAFLGSQILKNLPAYNTRAYRSDGKTAAQHYAAWHKYWSEYIDERAKRGLYIEVASPTYHAYTLQPIINIYNFAEDPALRRKAGMLLDLDFADYAEEQVNHTWGAAKTRAYPDRVFDNIGQDQMVGFDRVLFGGANYETNSSAIFGTSGYYPPPAIVSLATDYSGRGSYEAISRRPGAGTPDWDDDKNYHVNSDKSLLHYSYVTPDYMMSTTIPDPTTSYVDISNQNRWQGVIFNTTSTARVYPQVAKNSDTDRVFDAFRSVQKKNTLITRRRDTTYGMTVYFANVLDQLDEDASGWIFVKEGNAYLAVRPIGGYRWRTASKNKNADPKQNFIDLNDDNAPVVFEAAQSSKYGGNFANFKTDIKNNPIGYSGGLLNYTDTNGTQFAFFTDTRTSTINTDPVNTAPIKAFNSPFISSNFNSGLITITKSGLSATLDFRSPGNPIKTVAP